MELQAVRTYHHTRGARYPKRSYDKDGKIEEAPFIKEIYISEWGKEQDR